MLQETIACFSGPSSLIFLAKWAILKLKGGENKRVTQELQLSFQFFASVKVYFLEATMNVLGLTQGQMVGSLIMKKLYPLYLFFSQG